MLLPSLNAGQCAAQRQRWYCSLGLKCWTARPQLIEPEIKCVPFFVAYDNSAQNPANPDPNRVVPWGEQSWDEMLYGTVLYREMTPSQVSAR